MVCKNFCLPSSSLLPVVGPRHNVSMRSCSPPPVPGLHRPRAHTQSPAQLSPHRRWWRATKFSSGLVVAEAASEVMQQAEQEAAECPPQLTAARTLDISTLDIHNVYQDWAFYF